MNYPLVSILIRANTKNENRRVHIRDNRAGLIWVFRYGANSRDRTDDLRITNALLYQLSYVGLGVKRAKP